MHLSRRQLLRVPRRAAALEHLWLHVHRRAMACRFDVTMCASHTWATPAATEALAEVTRMDEWLSIFRPASEASGVNAHAHDAPQPASDAMLALLDRCRQLHHATEGCFDPTATVLSRCWGFLERAGRVPASHDLARAMAAVGMEHVESDSTARTVHLARPGMMIGFGSIGKGLALDRAAAGLRRHGVGEALLSAAGSSVVAVGEGEGGAGWPIGLQDPLDPSRRSGLLRLSGVALGVSACTEQWFDAEGRRWGHIIDPRTGWPVEGRLQVAVVAPDAATADALATAFFVGGPALARRTCDRIEGTLAVFQEEAAPHEPVLVGSSPNATLEAWHG